MPCRHRKGTVQSLECAAHRLDLGLALCACLIDAPAQDEQILGGRSSQVERTELEIEPDAGIDFPGRCEQRGNDLRLSAGIASAIHYPTAIHLQPAYADAGSGPGGLLQTEQAVREILSLPMHPHITPAEIAEVARAVRDFDQMSSTAAGAAAAGGQ